MRVQPHDTSIAIHKWVGPAQALVCAGQRHEGRFTAAHAAVKGGPTRQEVRHAGMRRCHVLAHPHVPLAQRAGRNGLFLGGEQIGSGQVTEQLAVNVLNRIRRIQRPSPFGPAVAVLQCLLCRNVGHGQALLGGKRRVCGKVLTQGSVYLVRAGVLALYAVGATPSET